MSWFCGNPITKILPFKFLKQHNLKEEHSKRIFRKMRAMMNAVVEGAEKVNAWTRQPSGPWGLPMAL
jgi:hypothetical protein